MNPLLAFSPLSKGSYGLHRARSEPVIYFQLVERCFPRLFPLQHLPDSEVHIPEFASLRLFRFQGFMGPHSGLLLPNPLNRISGSSVLGVTPLQSFIPFKASNPFRDPWLSCRLPTDSGLAATSELSTP